jgi:hypothetical protein
MRILLLMALDLFVSKVSPSISRALSHHAASFGLLSLALQRA